MILFNTLLLCGLGATFSHTSHSDSTNDANAIRHSQSFPPTLPLTLPPTPARLLPQIQTRRNIPFARITDIMRRFRDYSTQKKRLLWLMSSLIFGCALMSLVEYLLKISNVWIAQHGTLTISASMTGAITIPLAIILSLINSIFAFLTANEEFRMIREVDTQNRLSITNIINTASVDMSAISFLLLVIFNTRYFPEIHNNFATLFFSLTTVGCGAKLWIHEVLKKQGVLQKRYLKMWVIFGLLIVGFTGIGVMNAVDHTKSQAYFALFEYLFAWGAILHAGDMWHMFEEIARHHASTVALTNV